MPIKRAENYFYKRGYDNKKVYKDMGYSILAYTDHNVLIPHPELADEDFLPLYGYEFDFTGGGWVMIKADKLDYKTVTNVLVEGNFYSSQ